MNCPGRSLHGWLALWLAGMLLGLLAALPLRAQTLESALSPGELTRAHAKQQDDCAACHVRFDKAGQDQRCAECHKPVAQDLRQRQGLHGRQAAGKACRSCHTEHKGREAKIVQLDPRHFDHAQTDWPLRLAHASVDCARCHAPGKRWAQAPQTCAACHQKDDPHKGALGQQCADCHTEQRWSEARFDHERTRFSLKGQHARTACADCHPKARYQDTPSTCIGCHRADDRHKGRFGEQCADCHAEQSWKTVNFNHDSETRYPLRGKHRAVRCDSCHTGMLHRDKPASDCVGCHRADDRHQGSLGSDCASCHQESGWKQTGRFDHERSRFPLLGRHADARCDACHRMAGEARSSYRGTPTGCVACHRGDDRHRGNLGEACASCHGERTWKLPRFDHAATRFPLRGAHLAGQGGCQGCHADLQHYRGTATDCQACHRKDDRHEGQLGPQCASCHHERRWTDTGFDHNRARFTLQGSHQAARCQDCHRTPRFRDAPRDCAGCHAKDDRHRGALGTDCGSCHNARHWQLAGFDHARQARWALTGRHAPLRCEACHRSPAPPGRPSAALGTDCLACHRRDDPHDGGFGGRCEQCHQTSGWRQLSHRRPAPPATTGARP